MNGTAIILTNFLKAAREAHAAAVLPVPAKASAPTPSEKAAPIPGRKTKAPNKAATYDVRPAASFAAQTVEDSATKPSDPKADAWTKALKEVNAPFLGSEPEATEPSETDRSAALFAQVEAWRQEKGR